jgi:hypothetical protein
MRMTLIIIISRILHHSLLLHNLPNFFLLSRIHLLDTSTTIEEGTVAVVHPLIRNY